MLAQQTDGQQVPAVRERSSPSVVGQHVVDEGPACLTCRRRKLRCSREIPACASCVRLSTECIYDQVRRKPGIKTGAIDQLTKRLETIEKRLDRQDTDGTRLSQIAQVEDYLSQTFAFLADRLRNNCTGFARSGESLPQDFQQDHGGRQHLDAETSGDRQAKRRRLDGPTTIQGEAAVEISQSLPSANVLEAVLSEYFATVHHWIPMLHQARLRNRLKDPSERPKLTVLLHGLTAVSLKRISLDEIQMTRFDVDKQVARSLELVLLNTLNDLNIENLQALTMITFDRIGSGNLSGAWSLVGALTRTVDYLQLTVEPTTTNGRRLLESLHFLDVARDFAEAEERRRVFWNVFLLDRFCSIACGWSTGFTSDNVSRQLPCNGALWRKNEFVIAPFFGLWDKQAAKMGNSITFLPTHRHHAEQGQTRNTSPGGPPEPDIRANLGAVAYRIEATESLSQISSFFLQQPVNFSNKEEVANWLTRFKELDLRLVHWKLFLPKKWKDSNVSPDETQVRMDPNLTLAHITHNTSMILLHQHIAYPAPTLSQIVNLPSTCSAETCHLAAVETASIACKYLKHTKHIMVPGEFAFCIFLAARVLLVHCRHFGVDVAPEFFQLVECLQEMSIRWHGPVRSQDRNAVSEDNHSARLDLAGKYAAYLWKLRSDSADSSASIMDILFQPGASLFMPAGSQVVTSPFAEPVSRREFHEHPSVGAADSRLQRPILSRQNTSDTVPAQTGHEPRSVNSHNVQHMLLDRSYTNNDSSTFRPSVDGSGTGLNGLGRLEQHGGLTSPRQSEVGNFGTVPIPHFYTPGIQFATLAPGTANMSDNILGQQFSDLDRVITFDGADFALESVLGIDYAS